jgi:hypothetical protein
MNQILSKSYSILDGERNLNSFDDIIFCPRNSDGYGIRIRFANQFGVSIQCGEWNYSTPNTKGTPFEEFTQFELALLDFREDKAGELIYPPNYHDVEGFLSKNKIWNRILQVKAGLLNVYCVE